MIIWEYRKIIFYLMKPILVLVLACTALATTETEYIQLIHKIDATPFGRTLFDTIYL